MSVRMEVVNRVNHVVPYWGPVIELKTLFVNTLMIQMLWVVFANMVSILSHLYIPQKKKEVFC